MKVLLINPNQFCDPPLGPVPPIGLDYLQGILEGEKHEVKLIDLMFEDDSELFSLIGSFTPDVVGITVRNIDDATWTTQRYFLPRIESIIQTLKEARLENIIVGGAGFTSVAKLAFQVLSADYGIVGDGELPLLNLLKEIEKRAKTIKTPGVIFREGDKIKMNSRIFCDVNQLPDNPRTLVDNLSYRKAFGTCNIETKRGCPMECAFCQDPLVGGRYYSHRIRHPERVADEFQRLHEQGIEYVHIVDPEFNLPLEHALAVSKELAKRKNRVGWLCFIHPIASAVSEELVKYMKDAGCQEVTIGVDTGSPKILKRVNIHHSPEEVKQVMKLFAKYGITANQIYVIGCPGEGLDELNETLDLIEQSEPKVAILNTGIRIYPNTSFERLCREEGILQPEKSCLEPTFYRLEHLRKELLPVLKKRCFEHFNWILPALKEGLS